MMKTVQDMKIEIGSLKKTQNKKKTWKRIKKSDKTHRSMPHHQSAKHLITDIKDKVEEMDTSVK